MALGFLDSNSNNNGARSLLWITRNKSLAIRRANILTGGQTGIRYCFYTLFFLKQKRGAGGGKGRVCVSCFRALVSVREF